MQDVKTQLDWTSLTLGSPWYKLLYAVMPWLAEARRVRRGLQGARQVRISYLIWLLRWSMQAKHTQDKIQELLCGSFCARFSHACSLAGVLGCVQNTHARKFGVSQDC